MAELRYSIKDLENFTLIKAHTIRIWEQRYGLLSPKRTDTNIRYYSENDLKKILNINLLYTSGYKISKIASLTESEIISASKAIILVEESEKQSEIDSLTLLILDFNGEEIKAVLENKYVSEGIENLYQFLVLPLLEKVGQLWQVNSINIIHEHYFSNIFREFLITKINALDINHDSSKKAMLFLHDNEEHEFSILLYYYILKKAGYLCYYFGQKIPIKEAFIAFAQIKPQLVATTFTAKLSDKNLEKITDVLVSFSKNSKVLVSGSQLSFIEPKLPKEILRIKTIDQLKSLVK